MGFCFSKPAPDTTATPGSTLNTTSEKAPAASPKSPTEIFFNSVKARRTHYALTNKSTISDEKLLALVEEAVKHCPTAFNSQSSRAVLLLGKDQIKLWEFAKEAIRAVTPESGWEASMARLSGFQNAHGTILLFEDKSVITGLQTNMPTYADKFPQWADHANGMLAYILWTSISLFPTMGCNLQHYNPLIDAQVIKEWSVPESWELKAQLVFGEINAEVEGDKGAGDKVFGTVQGERVRAFGAA